MVPATLQFIIAMVAYAINDRLGRRVDYLQEEVRVLKEALAAATGKSRVDFTVEQRRRLALKGKQLTAEERRACGQIVRPETILAWFRQLAADKYDGSESRKVSRPRKASDIRLQVLDMARSQGPRLRHDDMFGAKPDLLHVRPPLPLGPTTGCFQAGTACVGGTASACSGPESCPSGFVCCPSSPLTLPNPGPACYAGACPSATSPL